MAGVARGAVPTCRRRYPDFPEPTGGTPARPTFSLPQVEAWLSANGRLAAISPTDRLWQELVAYSDEWRLAEALADVAAFLSFLESGYLYAGSRSTWEE